MYKKVLVPVALDHSRSFKAALDVARLLSDDGAVVTVLNVIEKMPSYVDEYLPESHSKARISEVETELKAELGGVLDAKPVVISGRAGSAIVDYAVEYGFECIVITSHRPGLTDYFLGSTAARVVRHAPCSVHVIR